jgi:lysophospholipase L1-like esterase
MLFGKDERLVMIGDSVTEHQKLNPDGEGLFEAIGRGWGGYVAQVDGALQTVYPDLAVRVTNKGISGNTTRELAERWNADVFALKPDWLSVMIGINDVWRQFDMPRQPEKGVPPEEYGATLERLAAETAPRLKGLVLLTPYYMEPNRGDAMRKRMDEYGAIVRETAKRHGAILCDVQAAFDKVLRYFHPNAIAWDRIHPNHIGSMVIAKAFLDAVGFDWNRKL